MCSVLDHIYNRPCGASAMHKIGEEIPHDHPAPVRHNLTAYVCCFHFQKILGHRACQLSMMGVSVDTADHARTAD